MATDNGPSKAMFLEMLADYEEHRFEVMKAISLAGKVLALWEKKGGHKKDLRDGYALRQLPVEEQKAELRRQHRVAEWMGLISQDATGQGTFERLFDLTPEPATGIGGAPLGSKLSIGRAKSAGFNDGKHKKGPSMAEGLELYQFSPGSPEALAYAEGFGEGLPLRPPPKASAADKDAASEVKPSAIDEMVRKLNAMDATDPKKRGRQPKLMSPPDGPDDMDDVPDMIH